MPFMCMRDCLVFWVQRGYPTLVLAFCFGFGLDSNQSPGYGRGSSKHSRLLTICKCPNSSLIRNHLCLFPHSEIGLAESENPWFPAIPYQADVVRLVYVAQALVGFLSQRACRNALASGQALDFEVFKCGELIPGSD